MKLLILSNKYIFFYAESVAKPRQNGNSEQATENGDSKAEHGGGGGHGIQTDHPTSYIETMMHLFKGNVGPGLFAMGDAFKNAGIIVGPILTLLLGLVCVHSQHILVFIFKYFIYIIIVAIFFSL